MDLIKYQFVDPQEICTLQDDEFNQLLKAKIYAMNANFAQDEDCMERLLKNITQLPINKQTLKLLKDLVIYFQSPILYHLEQFYKKHEKHFKNLLNSENPNSKELKILQQIGFIYQKLTSGQQKIEQLQFLKDYGTTNKEIKFDKKDQLYQGKYLRWLKKSLIGLQIFREEVPDQEARQKWIQNLENQFEQIVKGKSSVWLQRLAMQDIIGQAEQISYSQNRISKKQSKNYDKPFKRIQQHFRQEGKEHIGKQIQLQESIDQKKYESLKQVSKQNQILPSHRKFFYENQNLSHAQDINLEYKNFIAPYDKHCITLLRRAICAFLNRGGGAILVGIKQEVDRKSRIVKGQILSEFQKQQLLIEYKRICQQIQPDIISQGKYQIKFIPIKKKNGNYIKGKYIVRVQVAKGDNKCLYTVNQNGEDFVCFRTSNQVLRRSITQITLSNFKRRLLDPPNHPRINPYPEPEIGIPLLSNKNERKFDQDHEYCPDEDQYEEYYKNPYFENKKKWRPKMDPVSPATKESDKKELVYFNAKNNFVKQQSNTQVKAEFKKKKFLLDEQDEEDNQKKGSKDQQKGNNKKNQSNQKDKKDQEEQLDFQPINQGLPKKQYFHSKQFYQPFERNEPKKDKSNNYIEKPDVTRFQKYEYDRPSLAVYVDKPSALDILVIGALFNTVKQVATKVNLPLVEPAIMCNNEIVTWLSVNSKDPKANQILKEFMVVMEAAWRKQMDGKQKKQIKIRKLFSNVYFQDQILLNKLIHKFRHDQQFYEPHKGLYYYACKDKQQAIIAYMIAYEMNIKIKFISTEDMKKKKLEHLKSIAEKKQNQKKKDNQLNSFFN